MTTHSTAYLATRAAMLRDHVHATWTTRDGYAFFQNDPMYPSSPSYSFHLKTWGTVFAEIPCIASSGDGVSLMRHAADTLPDDMPIFDMRPQMSSGFLYLETPLEGRGATDDETIPINAFIWTPIPEEIVGPNSRGEKGPLLWLATISVVWTDTGTKLLSGAYHWMIRRRFTFADAREWVADNRSGQEAVRDLKVVIAFNLLLEQEVFQTESQLPQRQYRRQQERQTGRRVDPVTIAQLPRRRHSNQSNGHTDREYTHRWMVSGHWRNQWYPKTQTHRPKWIAPHIKGPDDKPFVPKDRRYVFDPKGAE